MSPSSYLLADRNKVTKKPVTWEFLFPHFTPSPRISGGPKWKFTLAQRLVWQAESPRVSSSLREAVLRETTKELHHCHSWEPFPDSRLHFALLFPLRQLPNLSWKCTSLLLALTLLFPGAFSYYWQVGQGVDVMFSLPFLSPLPPRQLLSPPSNKTKVLRLMQAREGWRVIPNTGAYDYRCKWNTCLQVATARHHQKSPNLRILASPIVTAQRNPRGRLITLHTCHNDIRSPGHCWEDKRSFWSPGTGRLFFFLWPPQPPVT